MILKWRRNRHKISCLFREITNPAGRKELVTFVYCVTCDKPYIGTGHRQFREWLREHDVKVKRK